MAGGGVKPGMSYGSSDELGFDVGENPVHVHDLQATILHLLGMEHTRLTYRFQGRDYRLTDVHGEVVNADFGLTWSKLPSLLGAEQARQLGPHAVSRPKAPTPL